MTKKQREFIRMKYGGRCAYCGCELVKGWHVDEIMPVVRNKKWVDAHWSDGRKETATHNLENCKKGEEELFRKWIFGKWVADGCEHPENFILENQNPACASCNINKHSMPLEEFRKLIAGFMKHLNEVSTQYKIAKRYGLITETDAQVIFYFERQHEK